MLERRRSPRYAISVATTLWVADSVLRGAMLCNVNGGGICVELPKRARLHEGLPLKCTFTVKHNGSLLSVSSEGVVAWSRDGGKRYAGIAFTNMDEANRRNLELIVQRCDAGGA